jgi:hypothetical protein
MQEKKERETERKRKTLSGEKKEVSLKEFDRADIVRDVRFARLSGLGELGGKVGISICFARLDEVLAKYGSHSPSISWQPMGV